MWSRWHGQFLLPVQKAIVPTHIWRLPNTIQVSNITTDIRDKRRFGLSCLGTCHFLSPISLHSLRVLPVPKQNNRMLAVILTIGLPVWTCSQTATLDRNWNDYSYHTNNTVSDYPIQYITSCKLRQKGQTPVRFHLPISEQDAHLNNALRSQWLSLTWN